MHHIHVCLLLLRDECLGPWRRGVMHRPSEPGSFPDLLEAKLCQDRGEKFQIWEIVIVHTRGE